MKRHEELIDAAIILHGNRGEYDWGQSAYEQLIEYAGTPPSTVQYDAVQPDSWTELDIQLDEFAEFFECLFPEDTAADVRERYFMDALNQSLPGISATYAFSTSG